MTSFSPSSTSACIGFVVGLRAAILPAGGKNPARELRGFSDVVRK